MKWSLSIPQIYEAQGHTARLYKVYYGAQHWYYRDVCENDKITGITRAFLSWLPIKCHYSGKWFLRRHGIWLGAIIPQAKVRYLCHPKYGVAARKESKRLFDATERNCNTCTHLIRTSFKPDGSGLQPGICISESFDFQHHPYWRGSNLISFCPDDYMGMSCWTERTKEN